MLYYLIFTKKGVLLCLIIMHAPQKLCVNKYPQRLWAGIIYIFLLRIIAVLCALIITSRKGHFVSIKYCTAASHGVFGHQNVSHFVCALLEHFTYKHIYIATAYVRIFTEHRHKFNRSRIYENAVAFANIAWTEV